MAVRAVPGQHLSIVFALNVPTTSARSAGSVIGLPVGSPVLGHPCDGDRAKALISRSAPTTATAQSAMKKRKAA